MTLPRPIVNIICDYARDPLKAVRIEFHQRLLLGEIFAQKQWECFLARMPIWTRIKWKLYNFFTGRVHEDIEVANDVRYLLFKRFHPFDQVEYLHLKSLFLGGADAGPIRENIEIEIQQG